MTVLLIFIWAAIGTIIYLDYNLKSKEGHFLLAIVCGPAIWIITFARWISDKLGQ